MNVSNYQHRKVDTIIMTNEYLRKKKNVYIYINRKTNYSKIQPKQFNFNILFVIKVYVIQNEN